MDNIIKVYVPDRAEPFKLPASLTDAQIRTTVVQAGYSACENADMVKELNGTVVRFRRAVGGAKA